MMGLDSVTLVVTYHGYPVKVEVIEEQAFVTRRDLGILQVFISDRCVNPRERILGIDPAGVSDEVLEMVHVSMSPTYEVMPDTLITMKDLLLSREMSYYIYDYVEQYIDEGAFEEEFAANPTAGIPPHRWSEGYRCFLMFEG